MDREICTVWMPGGRNLKMRSGPGVTLDFYGGTARIIDGPRKEALLLTAMRLSEAKITFNGDWAKWLPEWMTLCGTDKPPVASMMVFNGEEYVHVDNGGVQSGWMPETMQKFGRHKLGCQCKVCKRIQMAKAGKLTGLPFGIKSDDIPGFNPVPDDSVEPIDIREEEPATVA